MYNELSRNITSKHSLITPVHTAVTGRARYKVYGLYGNKALKKYLESQLSQHRAIERVQANSDTGNILVLYHPNWSQSAIAGLIQKIVSNYSMDVSYTIPTQVINSEKVKSAISTEVLMTGAVGALALCTLAVYARGLDEKVLLTIQKLHSPFLDTVMVGATLFGEGTTLLLVSGLYRHWLLRQNRRQDANTLMVAAFGGIGLNCLLKLLFARSRPKLWDRIVEVGHYSFPSGHSMVSMIVYGYIGYTLAKQYPQYRNQISALAVAFIMAIGFSRLYLGVHWLTDVTAGYAAGLVWLSACILFNVKSNPVESSIQTNYSAPVLAGQFQN
ncbi:MAG: phosphatase PAP2 family protein [Calothrix sp. FI2-JRJ7]|jgi:undecaprenyl-diphosphatase|nr:phosphatase PAP2 family protein [Calothrix sp. FI2-JRJ7]